MTTEDLPNTLRLEETAPRARRLLAPSPGLGVGAAGGPEAASGGSAEASGRRRGPPDAHDAHLIAEKLRQAAAFDSAATLAGRAVHEEADALAATLIERARAALAKLMGGAPNSAIGADDAIALEAVMHTRGRPAMRVIEGGLEPLDPVKFPGSEMWQSLFDDHEQRLAQVAGKTGAVRIVDRLSGRTPWVQGTGWVIGGDRVVTNRHVLFPPFGVRLARRRPDNVTTARLKTDLDVMIDLAFDNGPERQQRLAAVEVLYVSEENDPVDVAVIRVQAAPEFAMPEPLELAKEAFDSDYLYIVGHPGRLQQVPENVQAVFGSPDERKRVSLGELMDPDQRRPGDLVHDASTIGGYSGGCVLGFLSKEVAGLHYYGDPENGNRAIMATALRSHPVAQFF